MIHLVGTCAGIDWTKFINFLPFSHFHQTDKRVSKWTCACRNYISCL